MLFHRKGLAFGYIFLLLCYLATSFLPSLVDKIILNPLMLIGNYLPNVSTAKTNIQSFELTLHNQQPLFQSLLIWFAVFVLAWVILDVFTVPRLSISPTIQIFETIK